MIIQWITENIIGILGILVGAFIAYHVFFLSKKLSSRAKLEHKEKIKQKAQEHLSHIRRENINNEVYLVNMRRYFKDYPSNTQKRFEGYSHLKAEIKATRFDGIEFFSAMPVQIYQKPNGDYSLKGKTKEEAFIAFPVGVVPYEWIEYIDLDGDEYAYVPLFYCYYRGRTNWKFWRKLLFFGYPYKRILYYRESDTYHEGSDPVDWKYREVDIVE